MKSISATVLYQPDESVVKNVQSYLPFFDRVILVDNSERTAEALGGLLANPKVVYLSCGGNKGIGYALNLAAEKAVEMGYEFLMTMDQDSEIIAEGFEKYRDICLSRQNTAVISPCYEIDRKKAVVLRDRVESVLWTMQSASFINLAVWRTLGGFDEQMFVDCTDYEYCLRARKNGFAVERYLGYAIKHCPGITRKTKIFGYKYGYCSPLRIYYQRRNLLTLYSRYRVFRIKLVLLVKRLKIILFFDRKKEFIKMYRKAKEDYKRGALGEYR